MKRMYGERSATASEPLIRVLYDGWPLAYERHSPAALHVFELLEALPGCVEPWVALPLKAGAAWEYHPAVQSGERKRIAPVYAPAPDTPGGQLRWEQSILPGLARQVNAQLIHTTSLRPPLFAPAPCVISPARPVDVESEPGGFAARLRESLGRGGLAGARAILWPADLPEVPFPAPIYRLPPLAHSAFFEPQETGLPISGGYALAPGPLDEAGVDLLAAAWSWASAGLGEESVLLAANFSSGAVEYLQSLCRAEGTGGKIDSVSLDTPEQWAEAYQHALVVMSAGPVVAWGDALLQALASARPLAAQETAWADARVGPAGFLTPIGDARAFGAAALTPLVEEPVAERLSQSARRWTANWKRETFAERLGEVYASVLEK